MDDLITRLRTVMAEVEARIRQGEVLSDEDVSPKLKEALSGTISGTDRLPLPDPPVSSKTYGPGLADDVSAARARPLKLDDYVPRDPLHAEGFDPEDFIGTGDRDPLGHDEAIRR